MYFFPFLVTVNYLKHYMKIKETVELKSNNEKGFKKRRRRGVGFKTPHSVTKVIWLVGEEAKVPERAVNGAKPTKNRTPPHKQHRKYAGMVAFLLRHGVQPC